MIDLAQWTESQGFWDKAGWCYPKAEEGFGCSVNPNKNDEISQFALLITWVWGYNHLHIWRATEPFKGLESVSFNNNEEATLHFVFIIHFHQLLRLQKQNGENKQSSKHFMGVVFLSFSSPFWQLAISDRAAISDYTTCDSRSV